MLWLGNDANPTISARVQAATTVIEAALAEDLVDLVPSYASVLIIYDAMRTDHLSVGHRVREALTDLTTIDLAAGREVVLPVYYGIEAGADLECLAKAAELSVEEVIDLHCGTDYRVYAIGFAPGFAYLGQVDQRIARPRLATPRLQVPRGSVAIADRQTAVYPATSPGGWNLIGRCPIEMFNPAGSPIMPVAVGDRVRFEPVTRNRYLELGGNLS